MFESIIAVWLNTFFAAILLCFNVVLVLYHLPAHPYWGAFTCVGLVLLAEHIVWIPSMFLVHPSPPDKLFATLVMMVSIFTGFAVSWKVALSLLLFFVTFQAIFAKAHKVCEIVTQIDAQWALLLPLLQQCFEYFGAASRSE